MKMHTILYGQVLLSIDRWLLFLLFFVYTGGVGYLWVSWRAMLTAVYITNEQRS